MFDLSNAATYWLTLTNMGLGILTLATVIVVGLEILQDLHRRNH